MYRHFRYSSDYTHSLLNKTTDTGVMNIPQRHRPEVIHPFQNVAMIKIDKQEKIDPSPTKCTVKYLIFNPVKYNI